MVISRMELMELVRKADDGDVDFLCEGVRILAQALMEAEVTELVGAEHGERNPEGRAAQRNGYRDRDWDTRAGTVALRIPKLRQGSYFPTILEARKRAERALCAVVAQCYVEGDRPDGSMTSPRPWASIRSPSRTSRGSAPTSTSWSKPGATGRWMPAPTPSYGSTRWR